METWYWEKELNSLLLEIIERKKMDCTQKDRIKEPPFRVLKNWGLVRGFFMSLYRSIADTPVRFVWLRANVTLELFLFLRKFVASCLGWNKCIFSLVWMMRVSHKHFINKICKWVGTYKLIKKIRHRNNLKVKIQMNWWWNVFEWAIVKTFLVLKCLFSNQFKS